MSKKILKDNISINDKKPGTYVRGHVVIKDFDGNIILEEDNLVLMNTRIFLFEHLFKLGRPEGFSYKESVNGTFVEASGVVSSVYNHDENHNRKLCLFTVGSGGADLNSTPFNPYVPEFNDTRLTTPVYFKRVDGGSYGDSPSIVEKESDLPPVYRDEVDNKGNIVRRTYNKYYKCNPDGNIEELNVGGVNYFGKLFEDIKWEINPNSGEVAVRMNLKIEPSECRGSIINEIGLILADFVETANGSNVFNDIKPNWELATRLTFDSESLTATDKGLDIDYVMYI